MKPKELKDWNLFSVRCTYPPLPLAADKCPSFSGRQTTT